jgi:hypothetical protein
MKAPFVAKLLSFLILITIHSSTFGQTSTDGPILGFSEGNHRLDCTVIRPWAGNGRPGDIPNGGFPVIGWTNGWGQGNVHGANQTENYISGLYNWAETGDYIVIAANQWSARAPDILQCLQWLIDENRDPSSNYFEAVDASRIGLSGHSQGGGAALKAGDGLLIDGPGYTAVTTVVAMNPYGPSWAKTREQNGQIMLLGGTNDGVTPTASFSPVLNNSILSDDPGGVQGELIDGTHCNPVCHNDFGVFGELALLWWQIFLRDDLSACGGLMAILDNSTPTQWNTDYSNNFICFP